LPVRIEIIVVENLLSKECLFALLNWLTCDEG
jgi:hypothetical protein